MHSLIPFPWAPLRPGRIAGVLALVGVAAASPLHAGLRWTSTSAALHVGAGEAVARTTFSYQNDGDTAVEILRVEPGCGCTAATPTKTRLGPGEKGELPVEFRRGGREGTFRLSIMVHHSAADVPTVLALNVDIESLVTIDPRFVFWKTGEPREAKSVRVVVSPRHSVKFTAPVCGNTRFTAKLVPVADGGREYDLVVTPPEGGPTFSSVTLRATPDGGAAESVFTILARTL